MSLPIKLSADNIVALTLEVVNLFMYSFTTVLLNHLINCCKKQNEKLNKNIKLLIKK